MFVGLIFALTSGVRPKLKAVSITMPYLFLLTDIGSWWLTKLNPHFALLVIVGGGGRAMAFVFMLVVVRDVGSPAPPALPRPPPSFAARLVL